MGSVDSTNGKRLVSGKEDEAKGQGGKDTLATCYREGGLPVYSVHND